MNEKTIQAPCAIRKDRFFFKRGRKVNLQRVFRREVFDIMVGRYDARAALEHFDLARRYATNKALELDYLLYSAEACAALGDLDGAEQRLAFALKMDPGFEAARDLAKEYGFKIGRP